MSNLEILHTIFTQFPLALAGSLLAGILCAYLGVYVVTKRIVFVGATLTEVAVAGLAFAELPFVGLYPAVGSLLFTFLGVIVLSRLLRNTKISRDSVLGASYVLAITLRVLLMQKSSGAEISEIDSILKGDMLFVTAEQFYLLLGTAAILFTLHLLFFKEFVFVSFDPEMATTQGFRSRWWEFLFYLTVGFAVSVSIRIVGDVFTFGFLVVPAIAALQIAKRVHRIFLTAVGLALLPPIVGLFLAFKLDLPAGPATVATCFILLPLAWIVKFFQRR